MLMTLLLLVSLQIFPAALAPQSGSAEHDDKILVAQRLADYREFEKKRVEYEREQKAKWQRRVQCREALARYVANKPQCIHSSAMAGCFPEVLLQLVDQYTGMSLDDYRNLFHSDLTVANEMNRAPNGGYREYQSLYLERCQLDSLEGLADVPGKEKTECLMLGANKISGHERDMKVLHTLPNLKCLDLRSNVLRRIPVLASHRALSECLLSDNVIERIPAGAFKGCTELRSLYMDNCGIRSVHADAFTGCNKLAVLWLRQNPLRDFPESIVVGSTLFVLNLSENCLPKEVVARIRRAWDDPRVNEAVLENRREPFAGRLNCDHQIRQTGKNDPVKPRRRLERFPEFDLLKDPGNGKLVKLEDLDPQQARRLIVYC